MLEPFDTPIVTQPSVPLRDDDGNVTAGTIYGATTIRLTSAQDDLADQGSKLWLQGGTPEAPLTDPDEYGFGALRCATDNLNGDNVEWIAYPADGTKHVFCFAYYVKPPPTSGTIRIEKQLDGVPAGSGAQKIGFFGNISFAPGGAFSITAGPAPTDVGSVEFIRAAYRPGDPEWSFQEQLGPLASLESLNCVSKLAGEGGTGSTWRAIGDDPRQPGASIRLAEGDVMTCRFVDSASAARVGTRAAQDHAQRHRRLRLRRHRHAGDQRDRGDHAARAGRGRRPREQHARAPQRELPHRGDLAGLERGRDVGAGVGLVRPQHSASSRATRSG